MGPWQHLGLTSDMEQLRKVVGIEFKRLRNIHHIELFRTREGLFAQWKQFVTSDEWSRPVHLMGHQQMALLAKMRPPDIQHKFENHQVDAQVNFLNQLERVLAAAGKFDQFQGGLEWLREIATNQHDFRMVSMEEIVADLHRLGSLMPAIHAHDRDLPSFPDDILLSVAPGADIQSQPAQSLVTIEGAVTSDNGGRNPFLTPGDLVIVGPINASGKGKGLPFHMGALMDIDYETSKGYSDDWDIVLFLFLFLLLLLLSLFSPCVFELAFHIYWPILEIEAM